MRYPIPVLTAVLVVMASPACVPLTGGNTGGEGLPMASIAIGDDVFTVEVAATAAAQRQGLMGRTELAEDAGMLFVFDHPIVPSFWMLNTLIPLDIAFIREDGTIASVDTMQPQTLDSHVPPEPVLYALEVPAGQLEARGIGPGDAVAIAYNEP